MDNEKLNQFRRILIKNDKSVSEIEYTKNNYDNSGNLIKENLPTITTDFCEIGLYNNEIYFIFILESKTFNIDLFNEFKDTPNIKIYGFVDFNKTLFPTENFNLDIFMKEIQNDKYLQIQFDFKNIETTDLFNEYVELVNVFEKNIVVVVNQLKVDLTKKKFSSKNYIV